MKHVIIATLLTLGIISGSQAYPLLPLHSIQTLHAKLNLNAAQETKWQSLQTQMHQFHILAKKDHKAIHHTLQNELEKLQPDFNKIIRLKNITASQLRPLKMQLQQDALAFYDSLNPHQKTLVRDAIRTRMAKWKRHHAPRYFN